MNHMANNKRVENVMVEKIKIVKAKIEDSQEIRNLETEVWGEECTNKYDIPMYIRFGYVYVAKEKI